MLFLYAVAIALLETPVVVSFRQPHYAGGDLSTRRTCLPSTTIG